MVSVSPVREIVRVGGIRVYVPAETAMPMPDVICPSGPGVRPTPNWNCARRLMALPAMTFSVTACSMKPSGAMISTPVASGHDAAHAAEMIEVRVRVDDGAHGRVADGAARERKTGGGGFGAGERIDDDEARCRR